MPSPAVLSYRCCSMPRQMLPFASMLVRVSRARPRCIRRESGRTGSPVFGSISSQASSPAGRPSSARRSRSRCSAAEGGTSPRVIPGRLAGSVPAASSGRQTWSVPAMHRLAQEVGPQLVQLADRLAVERLGEARLRGHPAVDRVRGEVLVQHDLGPAHAGQWRTPRRRRPPPSGRRSWARRSRWAAAAGPAASPSGVTVHEETKPSAVIGSSSSGSRTESSAASTRGASTTGGAGRARRSAELRRARWSRVT